MRELLIGRRAKIISGYNGQQFGQSRPKQTGRVITISGVYVVGEAVQVSFDEERVPLLLREVEILAEKGSDNRG